MQKLTAGSLLNTRKNVMPKIQSVRIYFPAIVENFKWAKLEKFWKIESNSNRSFTKIKNKNKKKSFNSTVLTTLHHNTIFDQIEKKITSLDCYKVLREFT